MFKTQPHPTALYLKHLRHILLKIEKSVSKTAEKHQKKQPSRR